MIDKIKAEYILSENMPDDIKLLSKLFSDNNYKLYLVGGCIRDTFLEKKVKDYDVCTDANTDNIIEILNSNNIGYNVQGEHFGVVVAKMKDGEYEIATFRKDITIEGNNRHCEVITDGVTIEEDVKRRDFTVCALFYDIVNNQIIDLVGGIEDLKNNIIKCVGIAEDRFNEDHLRKLRALRFSCKLGFKIEYNTLKAIQNDNSLNISKERIYNELLNAFESAIDKNDLLVLLFESKLNETIFKGLNVEFPDIRVFASISFNTFLTCILEKDINLSADILVKNYCIPYKTANSIMWLLEWRKKSIKDIDVFKMYNTRKNTNLSDSDLIYMGLFKSISFIKWEPIEGLSKKLIDEGYKGPELGKKITELNNIDFINNYL